jgi:hypothetical protein
VKNCFQKTDFAQFITFVSKNCGDKTILILQKQYNSTLTNWSGNGFFFFFTPPLKGERRKTHLFPLGIQGKNKWIFRKCQSRNK